MRNWKPLTVVVASGAKVPKLPVLLIKVTLGLSVVNVMLVVLVEALWYFAFVRNVFQSLVYSALCNATSCLFGLLVQLIWRMAI